MARVGFGAGNMDDRGSTRCFPKPPSAAVIPHLQSPATTTALAPPNYSFDCPPLTADLDVALDISHDSSAYHLI